MITSKTRKVKDILPFDSNFSFTDGTVIYKRATLQITESCPDYYRTMIQDAYRNGWLVPVAHMPENEFVLMGLSN